MRVALTCHANPSHLVGVLAAARALRLGGHDVAVASGPAVGDRIARAGFPLLPVASLLSMDEMMRARAGAVRPARPGRPPAHPFVTPSTSGQAAEITTVLGAWKPDCVLRDSTEMGGYVAAECLGVPSGTVDIAPLSPVARDGALPELNRLRAGFDLPPVSDPWHPVRPFRVGLVPDVFYPDGLRWPGARHYRPSTADDRADAEAAASLARPAGAGPLVLASLGMNAPHCDPRSTTVLNAIIEALGGLPVTGVVALGSGTDPGRWPGARAANVHLAAFVPQRAMLRSCDLFLTHGGFNGVREAFDAGVPMVAVPFFGDHPATAARLADLGLATPLDLAAVTAATVRAAVAAVLADTGFQARAGLMQQRMRALPPLDRLADDLEAFVARTANHVTSSTGRQRS
ncbi:glycosyltransferase [Krasilnikovia sp. MM14-A1259]|uniref:glycosyltransferase n=1 Tax=Krasilnikovia sp. MM14-A1259 TaxID=3373539 RepID=UPI003815569F